MADTTSPQQPQQPQYPNLNPTGTCKYTHSSPTPSPTLDQSASTTRESSTMEAITNSQAVQALNNGPMAEKARAEADQTKTEFSSLANSRTTPTTTTATGQNLTHYHSFFYNLLSWENPRATAISYAAVVTLIFATRYLPIIPYVLRLTWIVLGLTAGTEVIGQFALGRGLASSVRPKKYYTIPRATLERSLEDVEQLVNFFVIEFQRIIFAENVYTTMAAFVACFGSYYLMKIMPTWGLTLFFTTAVYFLPLIYTRNKEMIDGHLENAGTMINEQTSQVREITQQHTNRAVEASSKAFKTYSARAQEAMGTAKKTAVEKNIISPATAEKVTPEKAAPAAPAADIKPEVKSDAFPAAPTEEPTVPEVPGTSEPLIAH